jgi:hypothetical protein
MSDLQKQIQHAIDRRFRAAGVADELYFGMPAMFKAGPMSTVPSAQLGNRTDILSADIPAGGKTSARAIARMYAALLGEVDDVRLLSPQRLREATALIEAWSRPGLRQPVDMGPGLQSRPPRFHRR